MSDLIEELELAITAIKEGHSYTIRGLRLEMESENKLSVTGWSNYLNFRNLTQQYSLIELNQIKDLFREFASVSRELQSFISNRNVRYNLLFDDGGKGSISICFEMEGKVAWDAGIPN